MRCATCLPRALRDVSAPFTTFESLEPAGFPDAWEAGDHPVLVKAFGIVPIGEQIIGISFPEREDAVRVMRDTGRGLSGPLAIVTSWQHSIAISPTADGQTLYRDQLVFTAGPITPLLWVAYWAFWQWRAFGLRRFAPTWS